MLTEQQKNIALLKMGMPMKDSMVGVSAAVTPASSIRGDMSGGEDVLGELMYSAKADEQKKLDANKEAISHLSLAQQTADDIAHSSAKSAVALLAGLPPNLEGETLTDPKESSPEESSPISPDDTGPEDTDVIPKLFVNEKLASPKYISFKAIEVVYNKYKNDLGKNDFEKFENFVEKWRNATSKQDRDIIRADARLYYRATLFDMR